MKRTSKKLQLNKETIAILDDSQQKAIQGGYDNDSATITILMPDFTTETMYYCKHTLNGTCNDATCTCGPLS